MLPLSTSPPPPIPSSISRIQSHPINYIDTYLHLKVVSLSLFWYIACNTWHTVENMPGEYMIPDGTRDFENSRRICQTCEGDVVVLNTTNLVVMSIFNFASSGSESRVVGLPGHLRHRYPFYIIKMRIY